MSALAGVSKLSVDHMNTTLCSQLATLLYMTLPLSQRQTIICLHFTEDHCLPYNNTKLRVSPYFKINSVLEGILLYLILNR